MKGDFVSDDYATITQNPDMADFGRMMKNWSWNLSSLLNFVTARIFGIVNPLPYHLISLVIYLGVCLAGWVFLRLVVDEWLAKVTMVIFAVHPVHVETVSWISGRPYLMTAGLMLMALTMVLVWLKNKQGKYLATLGLSLFLLFFTDKIRGFAFFLLLILTGVIFKEKLGIKVKISKFFWLFLAGLIVTGIFAYPAAMARIESVNSGYNASDSVFYSPFFQYPTAVAKYLQLLVFPIDLTLYHTMFVFPVWLNWAIIVLYLICLGYFWFRQKTVFFGMAFIFLATAPSMLPIKVSWLVAERYILFGSLGFCLVLAVLFGEIDKKIKGAALVMTAVLVLVGGVRVFLRNIDWQTNHKLWVNTCQVSPNSHNAWNNIGDDYDKLQQYENAIKGFTQSTVVKPNYADAFHNRANIFFKTGRLDLARDSYETALKFSPGLFQTYMSLTQIDLMERKLDLALAHAQEGLKWQPNNPQMAYILGVVLAESGRVTEAKELLKNILTAVPNFSPARELLGKLPQ